MVSVLAAGYDVIQKDTCTLDKLAELRRMLDSAGEISLKVQSETNDHAYHIGQVVVPTGLFFIISATAGLKLGAVVALSAYFGYNYVFEPTSQVKVSEYVRSLNAEMRECQQKLGLYTDHIVLEQQVSGETPYQVVDSH